VQELQGPKTQMEHYRAGDEAAQMLPVSFEEWEDRARVILGAGPFGYVVGGAGAGDTMRANREAFGRWRIRPRVCTDISTRDLSVTIFGETYQVPFLLAPIGVLSILHRDAERAPARAAAKFKVPYILSNVSTASLEEIAKEMGDAPRWFQLYPPKAPELTRSFLQRAEAAGYKAVVVTLDSTMLGWREKDLRNGFLPFLSGEGMGNYFSDPEFKRMLKRPIAEDRHAAVDLALDQGNNSCFTWRELDQIRTMTKLPIVLKGVTHPADAELAMEHGMDGVIVSNHGGRQLDGAIATLDALPEICEVVRRRVPVLMDSGIRRGADVLKALALGATAVLVGRPYAYAMAVAGELGVSEVIQNLTAEVEIQLGVSGHTKISEVDQSLIELNK
jgi:lactate 2-monooxygenase